jgi:hypothetical protein
MAQDKKRQKFVELADRRVNKALEALRLVGNLSNRSNYVYSSQDVKQIVSALEGALSDVRRRFSSPSADRSDLFKLKS